MWVWNSFLFLISALKQPPGARLCHRASPATFGEQLPWPATFGGQRCGIGTPLPPSTRYQADCAWYLVRGRTRIARYQACLQNRVVQFPSPTITVRLFTVYQGICSCMGEYPRITVWNRCFVFKKIIFPPSWELWISNRTQRLPTVGDMSDTGLRVQGACIAAARSMQRRKTTYFCASCLRVQGKSAIFV